MIKRLAGLLGQLFFLLFIISGITFMLLKLAPGDPVLAILAANDSSLTQLEQKQLRDDMGLNMPVHKQFAQWLKQMLKFDWGKSIASNRDVLGLLIERLPATFLLICGSLAVLLLVSLPLGVLAAVYPGKGMDIFSRGVALFGASVPSFWLALLLIYVFSYRFQWLPTMGSGSWRHLVLPSLTLGFVMAPDYIRLLRAGLLDAFSQDYIRAARARGVSEWRIIFRHAARGAFVPIVSLSGIQLGALMAGSVVTETLFGWPGLGSLAMEAIRLRDYPVVQGYVLFCGLFFVCGNFFADFMAAALDPRIRLLKGRTGGAC